MHRIMLVDDEKRVISAIRRLLASSQYEIEGYTMGEEAVRRAQVAAFDLFMVDYRMPSMDGVQLLRELKALQPEAMRIILSGAADLDGLISAINDAEIYRFIAKPWDDYDLRVTVAKALEHRELLVENRRLADRVRAQEEALFHQQRELARLERENPGLTKVEWQEDGSILLRDEE